MRTLLLVDDEDAVVRAIHDTLEDSAYKVVSTTNPYRALELLKTDASIDLLITDLFMPAMDGATLLERGRELRPDLKILLTTGIASDQEIHRWRKRGEVIVSKPWLDEEFLAAVKAALAARRMDAYEPAPQQ